MRSREAFSHSLRDVVFEFVSNVGVRFPFLFWEVGEFEIRGSCLERAGRATNRRGMRTFQACQS